MGCANRYCNPEGYDRETSLKSYGGKGAYVTKCWLNGNHLQKNKEKYQNRQRGVERGGKSFFVGS